MIEKCAVALAVYCGWDYIVGFAATKALHLLFKKYLEMPSYRWEIKWVSIHWGIQEMTIEIGPFTWFNPRKFDKTPFFVEINRMSIRMKPLSLIGWAKRGEAIKLTHIEAERITVHLERSKKHGLNLQACLGLTEAEFKETVELMAMEVYEGSEDEDFDETGEVAQAAEEVLKVVEEEEEEPGEAAGKGEHQKEKGGGHWGLKFLGRFDVNRVSFRGIKAHVEAYLAASPTSEVDPHPVKMDLELQHKALRPRRNLKRGPNDGLYVDELIMKTVWCVVGRIIKQNKLTLIKQGAAAASDQAKAAAKSAGKGASNVMLNATLHKGVKVNDRLADLPRDLTLPSELVIVVHEAKHLITKDGAKPSSYVKVQIGKKGVKAKTAAQSSTKNPAWGERIVLAPIEGLDIDLRVQVYARHMFGAHDEQIGGTLKIPLASLVRGLDKDTWFKMPQDVDEENNAANDDDSAAPNNADSRPHIRLSLLLQ